MISRFESSRVAIVTLSVVIDQVVEEDCMEAERNLHRFHEFPGKAGP
jgi:hypothetical protein